MSDLLRQAYGVDTSKAVEGVWVTPTLLKGRDNPPQFKIARAAKDNRKYHAAITNYATRNRRKIDLGVIDSEAQLDKALDIFVNTILLDWRNIKDPNGQDVKYTPELGKHLMIELDDLYQELSQLAFHRDLYASEEVKDDLGK